MAARIYGQSALVWIGNHSYSIYLVHWPIIVLCMYRFGELSAAESIILGQASILGGWLLKSFVEDRLRWAPTGRAVATSLSIGLVTLVLSVGLLVTPRHYDTGGFTALTVLDPTYTEGIRRHSCLLNPNQSAADLPDECIEPDPDRKNLLLFGSSTAADMRVGMEEALPGWNILQATATGCHPLPRPHKRTSCHTLRKRFFEELSQIQDIDLVLISGMGNGSDSSRYDSLVAAMTDAKVDYVFVGPRPRYAKNLYPLIRQHGSIEGLDKKILRTASIPKDDPEYFPENRYFSQVDVFCKTKKACKWRDGYVNFYQDNLHLSPAGSKYLGDAFATWLDERD